MTAREQTDVERLEAMVFQFRALQEKELALLEKELARNRKLEAVAEAALILCDPTRPAGPVAWQQLRTALAALKD
jgi:hypothetical protein